MDRVCVCEEAPPAGLVACLRLQQMHARTLVLRQPPPLFNNNLTDRVRAI
jgi:hypothetical protein